MVKDGVIESQTFNELPKLRLSRVRASPEGHELEQLTLECTGWTLAEAAEGFDRLLDRLKELPPPEARVDCKPEGTG